MNTPTIILFFFAGFISQEQAIATADKYARVGVVRFRRGDLSEEVSEAAEQCSYVAGDCIPAAYDTVPRADSLLDAPVKLQRAGKPKPLVTDEKAVDLLQNDPAVPLPTADDAVPLPVAGA